MSNIVFRPMTATDLPAVIRLERLSFAQPWSRQMFLDEMALAPRTYFFVAESSGAGSRARKLVAYGGAWMVVDECHVVNLAVHPECRRRRLGSQCLLHLLSAAEARGARRFTLEVRADNLAAIRLYEKFGFLGVALRKNYYREENQDALIMWIHDITTETCRARLTALRAEVAAACP